MIKRNKKKAKIKSTWVVQFSVAKSGYKDIFFWYEHLINNSNFECITNQPVCAMITLVAGRSNLARSCSGGCAIQSLLVTIRNGPAESVIMSEPITMQRENSLKKKTLSYACLMIWRLVSTLSQ